MMRIGHRSPLVLIIQFILKKNIKQVILTALTFCFTTVSIATPVPDPNTIQKWDAGWKYPQAGWIVVHIEGEPYERGLQHGHLLASEISDYIQSLANFWGPGSASLAWEQARRLANVLFLRGFTQEQLKEMKGIADGATAEGATFEGREINLADIVTLNAANEIDTLDAALLATPTGIEGMSLNVKDNGSRSVTRRTRRHPTRCSAFAATGQATKDGKLVFGHVTMYDLYPANYYNVWMDVKPSSGHHFVMQTTPGGMHSGMDYSINDAGIVLSETTLDQTSIAVAGEPLAARIRDAEQYADSIDKATEILTRNGNGLSSTEWIMADIHRNEIALLTLGTNKNVLHRSSKNEWIADAEGFYWSDNNIKDTDVRMETVANVTGRPSPAAVYAPSNRDKVWLKLYDEGKGKIDTDFARRALTNPEIDSPFAVDAKYTNADMASVFETWASFGPPANSIWEPTTLERKNFPEIKPLIQNPWTVLGVSAPRTNMVATPVDRPNLHKIPEVHQKEETEEAAWHGTLLPIADSDIWLVTAFANYERIVAREKKLRRLSTNGELTADNREELGVEISFYRSIYAQGVRTGHDFPLFETKSSFRDDNWFRVATGKGVLFLHTLRGIVGAEKFDNAMDAFGRANAGKAVSSHDFEVFLQGKTEKKLEPLFNWWLRGLGLPKLSVVSAHMAPHGQRWRTTVHLDSTTQGPAFNVPVTVETSEGEVTQDKTFNAMHSVIEIYTNDRPERVVVDKYGMTARSNGSPFTILTFENELEDTLIVYGTVDEEIGNLEAALMLQRSLRRREFGVLPQIKKDQDVTEEEIRRHHLLLVGRPVTNSLTARFADQVAVKFGTRSFEVQDDVYAHEESAVVVAGDNPLNPRYSLVVIAGLGSLGTYQLTPVFQEDVLSYAQVVVLYHAHEKNAFVAPVKELSVEFQSGAAQTK